MLMEWFGFLQAHNYILEYPNQKEGAILYRIKDIDIVHLEEELDLVCMNEF